MSASAERPVLVTGAAGMLGRRLLSSAPEGVRALGTDLAHAPGLDFAGVDLGEEPALASLLERHGPWGGVIHAAAYTAVDRAESEPEAARRANAEVCGLLARLCARSGLPLVAVGTDFVFDGRKSAPYTEEDAPNPVSVYGRTKLEGERAVLEQHPQAAVVRTQWLYGPGGQHFPRTIVRLARERGELKVVDDQVGAPTSTLELAPALWDVLLRGGRGLYHAACEGACSWYRLTAALLEECGLSKVHLVPCTTAEFPRPARRPAYSVLDCTRLARLRGKRMLPWREALRAYLAEEPL